MFSCKVNCKLGCPKVTFQFITKYATSHISISERQNILVLRQKLTFKTQNDYLHLLSSDENRQKSVWKSLESKKHNQLTLIML